MGHTLIELDGKVDVVGSEATSDVVIDLSRLTFLSADGLWTLVKSARQLEAEDRRVELCRPSRQIRKVLEWTGSPIHVVLR